MRFVATKARRSTLISTIAVEPEVGTKSLVIVTPLERPGVIAAVGVSALIAAAVGGALLTTSDHLLHPLAFGLKVAVLAVLTVAAALYWVIHRPGNRIALLLLMPAFLLSYYLILAFPEGGLVETRGRLLFVALAWTGLASFLPWFFFSPVVSGGAPQAESR